MFSAIRPNGRPGWSLHAGIWASWAVAVAATWLFWPSELLPRPGEVLRAWLRLARDGMAGELYSSLECNLEAIGIATILSLLLSYSTVVPVLRPAAAAVSKARFFGLTGFVVLFTLAFGSGHWLKVSLLVFGMSVFFVTSMASVVDSVPREELDHARTLRMGEWRSVLEVVVLGRADHAFETLRQNAAIGWMMLTMVEGLTRAEGGIGTVLLNENKHFRLAEVFALQITILAVGVLQDRAIVLLKRIACPYSDLTLERR